MSTVKVNEGSASQIRFQLVNQDGNPTANSDVTAISFWLSETDGTAINSRSAQDILGTNGGAVGGDLTVSAVGITNPCSITTTADHGLTTGDFVYIDGIVGPTELNERRFTITRVNNTKFNLNQENALLLDAWVSGGTINTGLITLQLDAADNPIAGSVTVGDTEEHKATFSITWATNVKTHEEKILVRSLLEIT